MVEAQGDAGAAAKANPPLTTKPAVPKTDREIAMARMAEQMASTGERPIPPVPPPSPPAPPLHAGYSGMVRAIEPCHFGSLRAVGDEWLVENLPLWNDDPFIPVEAHTDPQTDEVTYRPFAEGSGPAVGNFKNRRLITSHSDSMAKRPSTV